MKGYIPQRQMGDRTTLSVAMARWI